MLRRTPSRRALRPLDSHGTPRTRLVRPLLRALGIPRRLLRTPAARDPYLHRAARRHRPHAPRTLPPVHLPRILALVPRPGLAWYEAGRKLASARQIFPQV